MKNKKIISIIIILSVFLFTELFFFLFSFEFKSWQYKIRDNLFKLRYALNGREDLYPFLYSVSCIDSDLRNLNIHGNDNMIYVDLLRALKGSNVKGIGIDHVFTGNILYSEADPLVNATGELKNVYYPVIPYQYNYNYNPALNPGQPVLAKKILWNPVITKKGIPLEADQLLTPYRDLANVAKGLGHILRNPDSDSIDRNIPLVIHYKDSYIPGFAFRMVCEFLNVPPENILISFGDSIILKNAEFPYSGLQKDIKIPIDKKGRMIINFSGPYFRSFNNYSFETVIKNKKTLRSALNIDENSLIFVSSHTIRDYDYNPGIFDKQYPLIYLQLEAANTILKGKFITEYSLFEKVLLRLILILVLWIISLKTHNHIFIIFSLVSGFLYIVFTVLGFFYLNRLSYILNPSIGFLLSIIVLFIYRTLNQVTMMRRRQQTQKEKLIHTNKMVTLGTMVSSIAHDVNNPNNVIKMEAGFISKNFLYFKEVLDKVSEEHLSLLLNEISYPELKNDFIQSIMGIQKSSQKIEEIVHELKNFYKKASPDRKEPVDLIEVINSSVFLLSHEINKTAIIHFAFPSNKLPMITGNPQRLEQVFINIIQNSCNAIKEKNQILETHIKRDISISVVSDNLKNLIRICLEDQGCGIDGKIIDRVTEPFFSTRLDRGGSGLGLYIVKSIINAHNGEIKLFSKEGEGTKIIISLPYQS